VPRVWIRTRMCAKLKQLWWIRVITKLPNSEQSYKGKVKTHKYINRQSQSTTLSQRFSNWPIASYFPCGNLNSCFTKFYDPDIEDGTEKYDAVNKYEYTITDNSVQGRTYMTWTNLNSYTTSSNEVNITWLLFIVYREMGSISLFVVFHLIFLFFTSVKIWSSIRYTDASCSMLKMNELWWIYFFWHFTGF
jgi:hypothetical protein